MSFISLCKACSISQMLPGIINICKLFGAMVFFCVCTAPKTMGSRPITGVPRQNINHDSKSNTTFVALVKSVKSQNGYFALLRLK